MTLTFHLDATYYDCVLRVRSGNGFNAAYRMTAAAPLGSPRIDTVTVDVPESACEVAVYPQYCEQLREEVKDFQGKGFWETLAVKTLGKFADSALRGGTLQTALTYRLDLRERLGRDALNDGAVHLTLTERSYNVTAEWASELLELYPVLYTFFELSEGEEPISPVRALGVNRKKFLGFARKFTLLQCTCCGFLLPPLIFLYPFLMLRLRRLTCGRPILRRLKRLYRLPPEKRAEKLTEEPTPENGDVFGKM